MRILAIDPGTAISGAMAALAGKTLFLDRIPYIKNELDYDQIVAIFDNFEPELIIIEKPFIMSGNRNKGLTTQLTTYGELQAICKLYCKEVIIVAPNTWKAKLKLKADKQESINMALKLFPSHDFKRTGRCKGPDHNLAEAALLAHYATL